MRPTRRKTDPAWAPLAPDPSRRRLTERERAVVLLVADGLPDRVIGRRLGLTPNTVASYIRRIRLRLNLDSRRALAAWVTARRDSHGGLRRAESESAGKAVSSGRC